LSRGDGDRGRAPDRATRESRCEERTWTCGTECGVAGGGGVSWMPAPAACLPPAGPGILESATKEILLAHTAKKFMTDAGRCFALRSPRVASSRTNRNPTGMTDRHHRTADRMAGHRPGGGNVTLPTLSTSAHPQITSATTLIFGRLIRIRGLKTLQSIRYVKYGDIHGVVCAQARLRLLARPFFSLCWTGTDSCSLGGGGQWSAW
jgi:hypothetical protein